MSSTALTHVDVGDVELCVRDVGTGPLVVLLHGTTASLGVWDAVVAHLGTGVRTVAVDQRGHGRSSKPPTGYDAKAYCTDLHDLVTGLDEGPVVLAGHSLGARNAVVFAATYPHLVRGVVAVDYTPYVEAQVLDALEKRVRGGDREFASTAEIEAYLTQRYPLLPMDAIRRRMDYGYVKDDAGWRALADPSAMVQTVDGLRRDFADEMRDVDVPATLMRGGLSRIVSVQAFAATRALRPDLRAVELPDVGHYIPEEDPAAVAAEIERILTQTSTA